MKKLLAIFFCLIGLQSAVYATDAPLPHWQILPEKSTIEWTATYGGKPVKGTFPDFTADIAFDPAHPEASHAVVKITMAKVKSGDSDAQENLPMSDWFAAEKFPLAIFEVNKFTDSGRDATRIGCRFCGEIYTTNGTLTIRDKPVKISMSFTMDFHDEKNIHYAAAVGQTTIKRTDFGVGQGDWAKTDTVADDVKVVIHLEAKEVQ